MKNRPLDGPLLLLFLLLLHTDFLSSSSCLCTATNRAGYMSESECGFHSFVSTLCTIILPSVALSPPRHPVFFVSSPPVLLLLLLVSARWCARTALGYLPGQCFLCVIKHPVSNRGGQPRERNTRENVIKRIVPDLYYAGFFRYSRGKLFGSMISRVRDRFVVRNARDRSALLSKDTRAI